MAQDQREITSQPADPPSNSPRVTAVACLGGVSLERGVPAGEIHDYIHEADNVVWVDVQDPGPAEIAMLIDEFGLHPLALEDPAHGQRRPKADEFPPARLAAGLVVSNPATRDEDRVRGSRRLLPRDVSPSPGRNNP